MLIRIFRTESALQFIILLLGGFLLWLPAFLNPLPAPSAWSPLPLFEIIYHFAGSQGLFTTILAFLLVITQGILLTLLLSGHDLSPRNNLLPAILYMIFMSWNPAMLTFHPALLANGFLLFFLFMFLKIYEKADAFKEVFSACFTLSLGAFFNAPLITLIILVWFGFLIYRVFTWREWIISLIGTILPLAYLAFLVFWKDNLLLYKANSLLFLNQLKLLDTNVDPVTLIILIIMGLLVFSAIFRVYSIIQEKVISIRKKFIFLIWFFLLAIPIFIFSGDSRWVQGSISLLPATALVSFHFSQIKKLFWWEILFTTLVLGLIWIRIF